jgi:CRISPR/Cas system-associated exonuclease Cas4 (RecB family)
MKTLIEIFNATLADPPKKTTSTKTKPFKIKPSMLGSPCMRKIYYSSARVEEDYGFDLAGKKRMALGDAIHQVLDSTFRKAGIIIDYVNPDGTPHKKFGFAEETTEFPIECQDIFVKDGYIDAVMVIDEELWIGEYKSINLRGFQNLAQAKMEHIIQAVVYWYVFNLMMSEGKFSHIEKLKPFTKAKGVRWLYVNKDDTEFKEYSMTEGDAIFKQIVDRIMAVRQHYDKKVLPPKTPDFCQSCNWRDKCKKNYNIE